MQIQKVLSVDQIDLAPPPDPTQPLSLLLHRDLSIESIR